MHRPILRPISRFAAGVVGATTALLTVMAVLGAGTPAQAQSPTIVVDSTDDRPDTNPSDGVCRTATGTCSLRAAITHANATNGPNTIEFTIPGGGIKTISVGSPLPVINDATGPLVIDGYTQGDARANGLAAGSDARLRVQLAGNNAIEPMLEVRSPGNTIRGLAIYGARINILIEGDEAVGNRIVGNFIGTDSTGTYENPIAVTGSDSGVGVLLQLGASQNEIGTAALADRNVISGNGGYALRLNHGETHHNFVQNNVVGLRPRLDGKLRQWHGIDLQWWTWGNMIGGYEPGEGNLVGGQTNRAGIELSHSATGNHVIGNLIGTMGDGNSVSSFSGNTYGIALKDDPHDNYIAENVIGGNGYGIWSKHNYNRRNMFVENRIGVGSAGAPIPNDHAEVYLAGLDEVWHGNVVHGEFSVTNNLVNQHYFYQPATTGRTRITQGQYVPGSGSLSNIAGQGQASQSSQAHAGIPGRAIDGTTNGSWAAGSVTHTQHEANPWWQLDLGRDSAIQQLVLHNRTDCCAQRLSNFTVFVSEQPFGNRTHGQLLADPSIWSHSVGSLSGPSLAIVAGVSGRHIRVQLAGTEALSLAEVQVFAVGGSPAIDIVPDGLAPNDPGDSDSGIQAGLNWPEITGIGPGKVFGTACASCTVEVYVSGRLTADGTIDTSGTAAGVGLAWIGSGRTDGAGQFSLADQRIVSGRTLSALAIDAADNTSELPSGRPIPSTHQGVDGQAAAAMQPFTPPASPDLPPRFRRGDQTAIEGLVVDLADDGVAGVGIDLFDEGRQNWLANTTTGANGSYRLPVDAGCYVMTFIAPNEAEFATGRYLNRSTCVSADAPSTVDATLLINGTGQPTSIGGRVIDRSDEPIQGINVTLFTSDQTGARIAYLRGGTTDSTGRFSFDLAEAGCHVATVRAPVGQVFVGSGSEWLNLHGCVDAGQTLNLDVAVVNASSLASAVVGGVVAGPPGPVADIGIDLFAATGDGDRGPYLQSVSTAGDGSFDFTVEPGCYILTFIAGPADTWADNGTRWLNLPRCVAADQTDRSANPRLN